MTPIEERQRDALQRVIDALKGQSAVARAIGGPVKQGHVFYWLQTGRIPAEHCPTMERETIRAGAPVRCEELCEGVDWAVLREQVEPAKTGA